MQLAIVHTRARTGIRAPAVTVEVHLANGLPAMSIVGLPEAAVREARDRVRSAILSSQFDFPARRITINLAPADLPKDGGGFDLPIALGILAASGQIPLEALRDGEFIGELGLTGELRAVAGALPAAIAAREAQRRIVVPAGNAAEVALIGDGAIHVARTLHQVCRALGDGQALPTPEAHEGVSIDASPDLADVRGQGIARRALEVAAAGRHHLLLSGVPGCGKSMLAARLCGILPALSNAEALDVASIASCSGQAHAQAWGTRPYRAPHHTASAVALIGGGSQPRPGEVSLAHHGVLFLDELPEWDRRALEVLREPLESGVVTISRAARQCEFPARFQLVAAMNPCPCGWAGDPSGRCRCPAEAIARYRQRISGPLLDRIDLHLDVPRLPADALRPDAPSGESSAHVRERVEVAWQRQRHRAGKPNALLSPQDLARDARLGERDLRLLEQAIDTLQLSARATHRVLRVARTIADLAGSDAIATAHLAEAIAYRSPTTGLPQRRAA